LAALGGAALALLPTGCAKGPSGTSGTTGGTGLGAGGKQLFVTVQVRGDVDLANDYYFVCFNITPAGTGAALTRNGFTGPVPVITDFESGGNGFAGGAFTTYVEIHQGQPQSSFGVYGIASAFRSRWPTSSKAPRSSPGGPPTPTRTSRSSR
jgi:hypothetical protein